MYKAIVVGTDGSERASLAYRHALELAKMSGAKLHAVQVVHLAVRPGITDLSGGQPEIDRMQVHAQRTGAVLLAEAEREGVSVEVHNPGAADVADAIVGVAEDVGADLIVVGNRGMSSMTRFVLGSVPNKISHRARCNLLIVNTEAT
ncbi:MAG: universal stress protein [Acidimicrobiales bacterium]|jgi:nucleotide-binding universal stress UspA family protein